MQQTQLHPEATRTRYPWELNDETRRIGREGLAQVRAVLKAKTEGPAQQALELDFSAAMPITTLPVPVPKPARPARLAA